MKYVANGKRYDPIKVGAEGDWFEDGRSCSDCGAANGDFHKPGCDCERCPACGAQLLSCDCELELFEELDMSKFQIKITIERIREENYEPGLFYYHIRHSDNNWGKPVTLEKKVIVNHYGTLTSTVCLDDLFLSRDFHQFNKQDRDIIYNNEDSGLFDGAVLFPKLK